MNNLLLILIVIFVISLVINKSCKETEPLEDIYAQNTCQDYKKMDRCTNRSWKPFMQRFCANTCSGQSSPPPPPPPPPPPSAQAGNYTKNNNINWSESSVRMHNTNCPWKGCYPYGNLNYCKSACNDTPYCKGFAREKNRWTTDDTKTTCTLFKNGDINSGNFKYDTDSDLYTKK